MLQPNTTISILNELYRVLMVNESRALIQPLKKKHYYFKTRFNGEVEFNAPMNPFNISPNSEVKIIKEN